MKRERINDEEFVLVDPVEFARLAAIWESSGGTTDPVGDGITLFEVDGSVQFRTRTVVTH